MYKLNFSLYGTLLINEPINVVKIEFGEKLKGKLIENPQRKCVFP